MSASGAARVCYTATCMAETLAETVASLLTESRAAHERARMARHQHQREAARVELTQARDTRMQAHEADPAHGSPAWAAEIPSHETMVGFYLKQLGPV